MGLVRKNGKEIETHFFRKRTNSMIAYMGKNYSGNDDHYDAVLLLMMMMMNLHKMSHYTTRRLFRIHLHWILRIISRQAAYA